MSPQLRAERLAEADARARAAELAALGDHQAAQEAQARADAADVRATVLEGQAEVYARWEASTAADRRSAELAKAELERRAAAEQDARAQAEAAAAKAETPDLPDPTSTTPDLVEPYAAADYGPGIEDPDAAAEALVAGMDQVELPEPDATSPIEDPELAAHGRGNGHPLPGPRGRRPKLASNGWPRPKPTGPSARPCGRRRHGTWRCTLPKHGSRARAHRPGAARRPARQKPPRGRSAAEAGL